MDLPLNDVGALTRILESLPEFVLVVDRARTIRYINRVEPGYDRDEVIGSPAEAFVFSDSKSDFDVSLDRVFATGEPVEFDVEVSLPDGSAAWYHSRMVPFRNDGELVGVVIIGTNITELKAAQAAAARLRRLLPICSWCDRIRTEEGSWETMEKYLRREDADQRHPRAVPGVLRAGDGRARARGRTGQRHRLKPRARGALDRDPEPLILRVLAPPVRERARATRRRANARSALRRRPHTWIER